MTLAEALSSLSLWLDSHALDVFAASVGLPVAGTIAAWVGKGGKTDTDGKAIASFLIAFALAVVLLEVALLSIGVFLQGRALVDTNLLLLTAPVLCLVLSIAGVRLVFPLSQLGSVKVLMNGFWFVAALGAFVWFLSKFRGWGIIFFGGIFQLILLLVLGGALIWWLGRRMLRSGDADG